MHKSLLLAAIACVLAFASPARAQFCPGVAPWVFDDVAASDPFCSYITWMAQNGVSLGCQIIDVNHRLYCPTANVPRSQMAAFMNRLVTQPDSTSISVGTISKPGGPFLHNFGFEGTFLGVNAGNFTLAGISNTGIGSSALSSNGNGTRNTGVGANALKTNVAGNDNTAIGANAMLNTTASQNVAVGADALRANTTGAANATVGQESMRLNTAGYNNAVLGLQALYSNTTGHDNAAVGFRAQYGANGSNNASLGTESLHSNTGLSNTALGYWALRNSTTGWFNIAIGAGAGLLRVTGDYNIDIGSDGVNGESNTVRIGNPLNHTRMFVSGVRGVTTGVNNGVNVVIDSAGQLGTISSSREGKEDIADMAEASAALMALRPVVFHYKSDHDPAGPRLQYGLIAEEVADVYPGLVAGNSQGRPETVMYQYLPPMLLNEFQKQQRTIEAQSREIAELKRAVEVLLARTSPEGRVATGPGSVPAR